jgi:hypothetical protein
MYHVWTSTSTFENVVTMETLRFAAQNRSPEWETSPRTKDVQDPQGIPVLEPFQQSPIGLLCSEKLLTTSKFLLTCLPNEPLHAQAPQRGAAAPAREVVEKAARPTTDCSVTLTKGRCRKRRPSPPPRNLSRTRGAPRNALSPSQQVTRTRPARQSNGKPELRLQSG